MIGLDILICYLLKVHFLKPEQAEFGVNLNTMM